MTKKKPCSIKANIDSYSSPNPINEYTVGMHDTIHFTVGFSVSASELHNDRAHAIEIGKRATWRLLERQIDAVTVKDDDR